MADDLDLSGKESDDSAETKRKPGRPKGSVSRRPSESKASEATDAVKATLTRIANALQKRTPDFAETLKRDAPKMAQVVGHQAARNPRIFRVVMLLFGPGSLAFAIEAFGPTLLHARRYLLDRRAARHVWDGPVDAEGFPVDEYGNRIEAA